MIVPTLFLFVSYGMNDVFAGVIQIRSDNIHSILSSNEIVFVNFYTRWCRFSKILHPIYDQLAEQMSKENHSIIIGKVDCDSEPLIAKKYHIKRYPTLKFFRNGLMSKEEYRGAREFHAFLAYLHKQSESAIIQMSNFDDRLKLNLKGNFIVGYFNDQNCFEYKIFFKVANLLRDQCQFIQINVQENVVNKSNFVVFHSSNGKEEKFLDQLNNEELFYLWSNKKCIPLIREITFENAEELTDEGLPFLILFHDQNDEEILSLFEKSVSRELLHEKTNINCLHADGVKFVYPLKHLGKSLNHLPLLILDNFKEIFLFPDIKQISEHGKLYRFIKDFLHSDRNDQSLKDNVRINSPLQSVFIHLKASRRRYSFDDEL